MSVPLNGTDCRISAAVRAIPLSGSSQPFPAGLDAGDILAGNPDFSAGSSRQIPTALWQAFDKLVIAFGFVVAIALSQRGRLPHRMDSLLVLDLNLLSGLGVLLFLGYWKVAAGALGFYREGWPVRASSTFRRALVCLIGCLPFAALPLAHSDRVLGLTGALMFGAAATLGTSGIQLIGQLVRSLTRSPRIQSVLIIGSGARALATWSYLRSRCADSHVVLGFLDTEVQPNLPQAGVPYLGSLEQLGSVLERHVIDEIHIALPVKSCYGEFQRVIGLCERTGVECIYPLDTFLHQSPRLALDTTGERPGVKVRPVPAQDPLLLKRMFDIVLSGLLLFLLSPLLVIVALGVKLTSRGPVLFAQNRYGKNKRLFRMYKFRSMRADAEQVLQRDPQLYAQYCQANFKLPERLDPRLTGLGRFLRKTSLDELPQLWNVLRGDMAIVGPRPVVPAELVHYGPVAYLLLALKPGLTNPWVLGGRSSVGYPERAELEVSYVRNWSLWRDASIFVRTIPCVLMGRGAH